MTTKTVLTWCSVLALAVPAWGRTGSQLVSDLRIMLGQTTASNSNWTDAQLYSLLNLAQDKISARGRVIEKDTTYGGGSLRTTAPSDFIALRGTAYIRHKGQDIIRVPMTNADTGIHIQTRIVTQQSDGEDFAIYEEGGNIVVTPMVNAKDSVHVYYFAQPAAIDSASECAYSDEWEAVLIYDAAVLAWQKVLNVTWFQATMAERDRLLSDILLQTRLRPQLVKQP